MIGGACQVDYVISLKRGVLLYHDGELLMQLSLMLCSGIFPLPAQVRTTYTGVESSWFSISRVAYDYYLRVDSIHVVLRRAQSLQLGYVFLA